MNLYRSTAIRRMENEERKTEEASHHFTKYILEKKLQILYTFLNSISHHIWSKCQVIIDDVNKGEGHSEATEKQIRDEKVCNKDVPCSKKNLQKMCCKKQKSQSKIPH